MEEDILNRIGLILGILGGVIIFKWGPPQPDLSDSVRLVTQEKDLGSLKLRLRYECFSRIGLGLIVLGFVVQLWATFL